MARIPAKSPSRKSSRWSVARGGNKLGRLRSLLVGDQRGVESLPENNPRRQPTLIRLRFLEQEAVL